MALSAESQSKINLLRAKMARGESPTDVEMLEAVKLLRQDRYSAVTASATKATARKAAAAPINGDDLLGEMML